MGAGLTPVGIMVYMYSRVVVGLWFKSTESCVASNQAALRHRKRVTITVIIVSVIYAICWLPDVTMFVVAAWGLSQLTTWFKKSIFRTSHIQRLCESSVVQYSDEEIS